MIPDYDEFAGLKTPPCSIEAEQSVIGAILIDSRLVDDVSEVIQAGDFFRPENRTIFETIQAMHSEGTGIDLVTLAERLASTGKLDAVGGAGYLAEVAGLTPTTANTIAYANAVRTKALDRGMITAANEIAELGFDGDVPTSEKLATAQQLVMALGETEAEKQLYGNDALRDWVDGIDERFNGEGGGFGVATGLKDVDARLNGLQPSDLILLAARPSMGKSTLAFQIAGHAAANDVATMVFSLEMSRRQVYDKIGACLGQIPLGRLRKGELVDEEWAKLSATVQRLKDKPLYVDDRAALHVNQVRATARRMHRRQPLGLIVVDYLQLLRGDGENRTNEIGSISRSLKALAKELDCPVVALSQLNRGLEDRTNKRPRNSDLRESGSLEQDADVILFVYRDEVYNPDTTYKGVAELICGKFRNGEIGTDYLASRLEYSRFENLAKPFEVVDNEPDRKRCAGFDY